jgi:raffinose/stachyose/melibiose transport system substrate-binding protein
MTRHVRMIWAPSRITLAVLLTIFVSITLTAVGHGAESGNRGVSSAGHALKTTTLTVWDMDYLPTSGDYNALKTMDRQFVAAHPGVKINHVGYPFTAYWPAKPAAAVATRQGPDIMAFALQGASPQLFKGTVPLRGLITQQQSKTMLLLSTIERNDPSVHEIPTTTYAYVWLYNKQLFTKAGLNASSPPQTFNQLMDACGKLNAAGITPIAGGFKDYLGQWYITYGFASQLFSPAKLATWASGKTGWTDPSMKASMDTFMTLVQKNCFPKSSEGYTASDADTQFNGGSAAMQYTCVGCFAMKDIEAGIGLTNVGAFRMPLLTGSAYPTHPMDIGPNMYYTITKWSKNCRLAWQYLSYLLSPSSQTLYWTKGGNLPAVRVKLTSSNPILGPVLTWLQDPAVHTGPKDASPQERDAFFKLFAPLVSGQTTVDKGLTDLQSLRDQNFQSGLLAPEATPASCK